MTAVDEHRLERIRQLEKHVVGLERYRTQQEQVLALAVICLSRLTGVATEDLLYALHSLNEAAA